MTTSLGALGDDEVTPGVERALGVFDLAAHRNDEDAVFVAKVDDVRGHTESGHEGAGAALDQQFDVVFEGLRERRQEVNPEGFGREFFGGGDLVREALARHRGGPETAVAPGVGDRGRERAVGDAAHAREHHRVFDVQHLGESRFHWSPFDPN